MNSRLENFKTYRNTFNFTYTKEFHNSRHSQARNTGTTTQIISLKKNIQLKPVSMKFGTQTAEILRKIVLSADLKMYFQGKN